MKEVLIEIKGTQGLDNETNVIELTTFGQFAIKNGKHYISYSERESMENVKTVVKADGNENVSINRSGAIEGKIMIRSGQRSNCYYSTTQGQLMLGIFGEKINNNLTEAGGSLSFSYTIDVENDLLSRNTVDIAIREVKNNV